MGKLEGREKNNGCHDLHERRGEREEGARMREDKKAK